MNANEGNVILLIQVMVSVAEGNIVNGDLEKTCSSCIDSINVENSNSSKAEAPKLSAERQQMKRKKKGGGYNLRKSLAWNRAFFTEEGIFSP